MVARFFVCTIITLPNTKSNNKNADSGQYRRYHCHKGGTSHYRPTHLVVDFSFSSPWLGRLLCQNLTDMSVTLYNNNVRLPLLSGAESTPSCSIDSIMLAARL